MKEMCVGLGIGVLMATSALAADPRSDDEIIAMLRGKTFVNAGAEISLGRNGALSGYIGDTTFKGAWTIRRGQWCRTISEPESLAGTECQEMTLDGRTITIVGRTGRPGTFEIR